MKKNLLPAICLLFACTGFSQEIIFPLNSTTNAMFNPLFFEVSELLAGEGLSGVSVGSNGIYAKHWSIAENTTEDCFYFTISCRSGYSFLLKKIVVSERRSLSGPLSIKFILEKEQQELVLLEENLEDDDKERTWVIDNLNVKLTPNERVKMILYGYHAESLAGSWRINDDGLKLYGEIQQSNSNDCSSFIEKSVGLLDAKIIESNMLDNYHELLKFDIVDQGETDDLPTLVEKMCFQLEADNYLTEELIESAYVIDLEGTQYVPDSINCFQNHFILYFSNYLPIIYNKSKKTFILHLKLKTHPLTDQSLFRISIEKQNQHWKASLNGSGFSETFPEKLNSSSHRISICSQKIIFDMLPEQAESGDLLQLNILASDMYRNIDQKNQSEVVLKLIYPLISEEYHNSFLNGISTFNNIPLEHAGKLYLQASTTNQEITGSDSLIVNFEKEILISPADSTSSEKQITIEHISPESALHVLQLKLNEISGKDKQEARIKRLRLKQFPTEDPVNFQSFIKQIMVKRNQQLISCETKIQRNCIDLLFEEDSLILENGDSLFLDVFACFEENEFKDGAIFQVYIPKSGHDCEAYNSGSQFMTSFYKQILSPVFQVQVKRTLLEIDQPKTIGRNQNFELKVKAVDKFGNHDKHYTSEILFSLHEGNGKLSISPTNSLMQQGFLSTKNIQYDGNDAFIVKIASDSLIALSEPIQCADQDSYIENNMQPETIYVFPGDSLIEFLSIKLFDTGLSDSLPSILKKIRLKNSFPGNSCIWPEFVKNIAVKIKDSLIYPDKLTLAIDKVDLSFENRQIYIKNNSFEKLNLLINVNEFPIKDKHVFECFIDKEKTEWITETQESSYMLNDMGQSIFSHRLMASIQASKIAASTSAFQSSDSLILNLSLTDQMNNTCLSTGKKLLVKTNQETLALDYNSQTPLYQLKIQPDNQRILVCDPENKLDSAEIALSWTERIYNWHRQDFESLHKNLANWTRTNYHPISGEYSLKEKSLIDSEYSHYTIYDKVLDLNKHHFSFEISIQTKDFPLNSSNSFGINFRTNKHTYWLGFDVSNLKELSFYQQEENQLKLIRRLGLIWHETYCAHFRIKQTNTGLWSFYFRPSENEAFHKLKEIDLPEISQVYNIEAKVQHRSNSNAGKIWLDNIRIESMNAIPVLKNIDFPERNKIELEFSEPIIEMPNSTITLTTIDGEIQKIKKHEFNQNFLFIESDLRQSETFVLKLKQFKDSDSLTFDKHDTLVFKYIPGFNSITINELMTDPSPVQGLPEEEYIELHNQYHEPVNLKNWQLQVNDKSIVLPSYQLNPGDFILLCKSNSFQNISPAIQLSDLPALNNDQVSIKLYTPYNELSSLIHFNLKNYEGPKKEGGWSLEKTSSGSMQSAHQHYAYSTDPTGGSPGEENSINLHKIDQNGPEIINCRPNSLHSCIITLSECIHVEKLNKQTVILNGKSNPFELRSINTYDAEVEVLFIDEFEKGKKHFIRIDSLKDLAGNETNSTNCSFFIGESPEEKEVLINELLFDPHPGSCDFIELYNKSNKLFDLKDFFITNTEDSKLTSISETSFEFPPHSYIAICNSIEKISPYYFIEDEAALLELKTLPNFVNREGFATLYHQSGIKIDSFYYSEKLHFKLLQATKGVSLERLDVEKATNDPQNWHSASETSGYGTPGYKNSQSKHFESKPEEVFSIQPEVFSPNNDGFEDHLCLQYQLPKSGNLLNCYVFDSRGVLKKHLAENHLTGIEGEIIWDGLDNFNQKLPPGIYVIYIEYYELNGIKNYLKKSCVIAY